MEWRHSRCRNMHVIQRSHHCGDQRFNIGVHSRLHRVHVEVVHGYAGREGHDAAGVELEQHAQVLEVVRVGVVHEHIPHDGARGGVDPVQLLRAQSYGCGCTRAVRRRVIAAQGHEAWAARLQLLEHLRRVGIR
jgi:hypothetical protein